MYVQVVTYGLGGMSESQYLDVANELAPRFSFTPGLQAKVWLEDPDLGRYGAVYFWEDRESMERFLRSELFEGTNPDFVEVESEGFSILENLTTQTQPGMQVVELSRRGAPKAVRSGGAGKIAATSSEAPPAKATAKRASATKAPAKKAPATKASAKAATVKTTPARRTAKKAGG
jgi:heme-degrading monooxygenase HmoA